ncbi:hypothetical protein [Fodinibius sp.]|uniref:hypothetical protein n=1 Tax=Fodinibius sp. TaxID=1872440 RepID=UPI003563AA43
MPKSFIQQKLLVRSSALFFLSAIICMGAACSKSDDQKRFEEQALRLPENITETNASGQKIEDKEDPDDWRISPMYQSLITIGKPYTQLPHPNPVGYNDRLILEIYLNNIETLSSIEVFALNPENQRTTLIAAQTDLSSPSLISMQMDGQHIAGSPGGSNASGLYRILIYDDRNNLITYGDIRVQ